MRVTGGILGGRNIKVPRGDVRPTQDMVREALFSILGESVIGSRFLDLYGGSGAVGLDAWSRGAEFVCWVESNGAVLKTLKGNVEQLCDGRTRVVRGDLPEVLQGCVGGEGSFDLVFADPPYEKARGEGVTAQSLLKAIDSGGVLDEDGLFVMEMLKRSDAVAADGWELIKEKTYGRTKLCFFRRTC